LCLAGPTALFASDRLAIPTVPLFLVGSTLLIIVQMPSLHIGFQERSTFGLGDEFSYVNTRAMQIYILLAGIHGLLMRGIVARVCITSGLAMFFVVLLFNYNVALGFLFSVAFANLFVFVPRDLTEETKISSSTAPALPVVLKAMQIERLRAGRV